VSHPSNFARDLTHISNAGDQQRKRISDLIIQFHRKNVNIDCRSQQLFTLLAERSGSPENILYLQTLMIHPQLGILIDP
jgi:hypothetical protein